MKHPDGAVEPSAAVPVTDSNYRYRTDASH
jgi:hypothetical protein